jgi:hypothetical protein
VELPPKKLESAVNRVRSGQTSKRAGLL